jgi:hypothetical protein
MLKCIWVLHSTTLLNIVNTARTSYSSGESSTAPNDEQQRLEKGWSTPPLTLVQDLQKYLLDRDWKS